MILPALKNQDCINIFVYVPLFRLKLATCVFVSMASLRVVAATSAFTLAGLTAREFATTLVSEFAPAAAPLLVPLGAALVQRVASTAVLPNCP